MDKEITRSGFMKLMAAGGATLFGLSPRLFGQTEKRGPVSPWARLKFQCRGGDLDDWNVHPNGDLNLIDAIREQTSVNADRTWNVSEISKLETMTPFPFLFMHAELAPELDTVSRVNLREYLLRGGFLFAEDCVHGKSRSDGSGDEFFRRMAEEELSGLVPGAKFEHLPFDHPVFHCFHHFENGMPHMQGIEHGLHGLTLNGRLLAVLSPSDIHCGWTNGERWFGRGKQQESFMMGMNIYVHAMTQSAVSASSKPAAA